MRYGPEARSHIESMEREIERMKMRIAGLDVENHSLIRCCDRIEAAGKALNEYYIYEYKIHGIAPPGDLLTAMDELGLLDANKE